MLHHLSNHLILGDRMTSLTKFLNTGYQNIIKHIDIIFFEPIVQIFLFYHGNNRIYISCLPSYIINAAQLSFVIECTFQGRKMPKTTFLTFNLRCCFRKSQLRSSGIWDYTDPKTCLIHSNTSITFLYDSISNEFIFFRVVVKIFF